MGGVSAEERLRQLGETLAAIEHERWADWQRWVHNNMGHTVETGSGLRFHTINAETVARWERQINTPYGSLSEEEKRSDREQVLRYWPVVVEFFAEWIARESDDGRWGGQPELAQRLREEMGVIVGP